MTIFIFKRDKSLILSLCGFLNAGLLGSCGRQETLSELSFVENPLTVNLLERTKDSPIDQSVFETISSPKVHEPDEQVISQGERLNHNSGALVCYYTVKKNSQQKYDSLKWIWGQKGLDSFSYDPMQLGDNTYYLQGVRLADNSVKVLESHAQLENICKNSMLKNGVFPNGTYDPNIAEFLKYTESTRYYPTYPFSTLDYERPILTSDVYDPQHVREFLPTNFKNLVAFGDSLSDTGNIHRRTEIFKSFGLETPAAPYWGGRFSNGPNWIDDMNLNFGISIFNWAFGSAETSNIVNFNIPWSMEEQVNDYVKNKGKYKGATSDYLYGGYGDFDHTLFSILIGGNNYIDFLDEDADKKQLVFANTKTKVNELQDVFVKRTVEDIHLAIDKLIAAGGRHFLLIYLPDISTVPDGSIEDIQRDHGYSPEKTEEVHKLLHDVSVLHNTELKQMLNEQYAGNNLGVEIITMDLFSLIDHMKKNPEQYGLGTEAKYTTIPCYRKDTDKSLCADADKYLFWDTVHPTTHVHQLMARALGQYLEAHYARH